MRDKVKIKILQNMLEEVTKKYDYFIKLQHEQNKHVFEMAIRDSLTKLYNRQYFFEYFEKILKKIKRDKHTVTLVFIDLDNFKSINDKFGHKEGDKVLVQVAKIFKNTFRSYDTIVRYGGDEFIVLMEYPKNTPQNIVLKLDIFVKNLEELFIKYKISASYGFVVAPDESEDINKLIQIADERMYKQKKSKKV